MNALLRAAILRDADTQLARADSYLSQERSFERTHDEQRLHTLRQVRNRLDLAFRQGIGIWNDDYKALRASVEEHIRELEGPPTLPGKPSRRRVVEQP